MFCQPFWISAIWSLLLPIVLAWCYHILVMLNGQGDLFALPVLSLLTFICRMFAQLCSCARFYSPSIVHALRIIFVSMRSVWEKSIPARFSCKGLLSWRFRVVRRRAMLHFGLGAPRCASAGDLCSHLGVLEPFARSLGGFPFGVSNT